MDDRLFDATGKLVSREAKKAQGTLAAADPALGRLIARVGPVGYALDVLHSPFRALARAVVGQQISGKAAEAIYNRVRTNFGARVFPTPDQILAASVETLRGCGLSRAKALSIQDLAAKTKDGTVPSLRALRQLSDAAIVEHLTAVRGVGVWTAQMLLIFRLGRADVMPSADYGVRKGFGLTFLKGALPTPTQVEKRGERWRPYRSVAAWYLWRSLELPRLHPR